MIEDRALALTLIAILVVTAGGRPAANLSTPRRRLWHE